MLGMCEKMYVFCFFQLVKGLRYTITAELSNTQCKKSTMLQTCDFYPESEKLKVTLIHVCLCKSNFINGTAWMFADIASHLILWLEFDFK